MVITQFKRIPFSASIESLTALASVCVRTRMAFP
jgi:hypothetical protein